MSYETIIKEWSRYSHIWTDISEYVADDTGNTASLGLILPTIFPKDAPIADSKPILSKVNSGEYPGKIAIGLPKEISTVPLRTPVKGYHDIPLKKAARTVITGDPIVTGQHVQQFLNDLEKFQQDLMANKKIQTETRGLSGTRNESLKDLLAESIVVSKNILQLTNEYLENYIMNALEKYGPVMTHKFISEMLSTESLVTGKCAQVNKVKLFLLRKFVAVNKDANFYEFIRQDKARLFGTLSHLTIPLDRFHFMIKSTKDVISTFGVLKLGNIDGTDANINFAAIKAGLVDFPGNMIIIYIKPSVTKGQGIIFDTPESKPSDKYMPITEDFVRRTTTIRKLENRVGDVVDNIVHLPKPGGICSLYETYNFIEFSFVTSGVSDNLVPWHRAIGFAVANGVTLPTNFDDTRNAIPNITHDGYNQCINNKFAKEHFRQDILVSSHDFKFGETQSSPLKDFIKEAMIDYIKEHPKHPEKINLKNIITEGIAKLLAEEGTVESKISSYLGSIELIKQFTKEYFAAIKFQTWGDHSVVSMGEVFTQCSLKCDKLGAWQIDTRTPKDLY
jgi:hypothetical protein